MQLCASRNVLYIFWDSLNLCVSLFRCIESTCSPHWYVCLRSEIAEIIFCSPRSFFTFVTRVYKFAQLWVHGIRSVSSEPLVDRPGKLRACVCDLVRARKRAGQQGLPHVQLQRPAELRGEDAAGEATATRRGDHLFETALSALSIKLMCSTFVDLYWTVCKIMELCSKPGNGELCVTYPHFHEGPAFLCCLPELGVLRYPLHQRKRGGCKRLRDVHLQTWTPREPV